MNPPIPLLGMYPKECNTGYSRSTCTPLFIAALFTIVKLWKQPRCPITDEWIKKMWYLYTMEFYLAMKKNEILLFSSEWMELENIILSEVSKVQRPKSCVPLHMWTLDLGQISNLVGLGSHANGRAHTGGMGIGRKPKT
jgi:hypothetical protein